MSAWVSQRADQLKAMGDNAPFYVYWIDIDGKQRSKSCGPGEAGAARALALKDQIQAEQTLGYFTGPPGKQKRLAGLSDGDIARLGRRDLVYFIEAAGLERVKIGRTADLPDRLRTLQQWSPVGLKVLLTLKGDAELEAKLHRKFAAWRLHGEWFQMSGRLHNAMWKLRYSTGNPLWDGRPAAGLSLD